VTNIPTDDDKTANISAIDLQDEIFVVAGTIKTMEAPIK